MRTRFLLLAAAVLIVHGKFVKIENLHLKEVKEDRKSDNWDSDSNRTTVLRAHRYDLPVDKEATLLQSVNEVQLDADNMSSDTSSKKEWKSFYYPHHHQHQYHTQGTTTNGIPYAWSNGVINNNNLLTVGTGFNTGVSATGLPGGDLGLKPGLGGTSSVQCLLFAVMGLVTFLLNSVMALLLSVKLPALDGLLGTLLGGLGLGGGALGALNKQDAVPDDTKSKHMEFVHFPGYHHHHHLHHENNPSGDNSEYFDKNR